MTTVTHDQISDVISQCATRPTAKIQSIFTFCGFEVVTSNVISETLTAWEIFDRDGHAWRVHTGPAANEMDPNLRVVAL